MQLSAMDRTERCNMNERCLEFGDNMSHDDHSGDEKCDCNSVDGEGTRLKSSLVVSEGAGIIDEIHVPNHTNDIGISHQHLYPKNHTLNALGNFIGIGSLPGISNLQHNDVLEKLRMQVRDMKVGLKDNECAASHSDAIGSNIIATPMNKTLTMPATTMASFTHAAQTLASQANSNLSSHLSTMYSMKSSLSSNGCHTSFPFTSPTAPTLKDGNPASNSSTSSETSNSSQQTTGWSFEEQYKQVRQLYEINNDPKRKEFLDDLFSFMQKRGTPITRLPIMAKHVLDLYELYNLVVARGGLVDVINKKLWQEVIKGLELPSSITSAAFTLRTQYMKYLYAYECEKLCLSTEKDLKAAVLGNRREGRRQSMNQYDTISNPIQMNPLTRQSVSGDIQHLAPMSLVSHANTRQAVAAAVVAQKLVQAIAPTDERMYNYLHLIQLGNGEDDVDKGLSNSCITSQQNQQIQYQQLSQQQQFRQFQHMQQLHEQVMHNSQSPEMSRRYGMNAIDMPHLALLHSIRSNNTQSTPETSTRENAKYEVEDIQRILASSILESMNMSDSTTNPYSGKRKLENTMDITEYNNFHNNLPPSKRLGLNSSPILRANGEKSDDDEHNLSENSSPVKRRNSNKNIHNNKSDDSTNENSPTTSGTLTDKTKNPSVYSSKYHSSSSNNVTPEIPTPMGQYETLNKLSAIHFHVTRNDINSDGKQEVDVSLELNGLEYTGVLRANTKSRASEIVSPIFATTVASNNDKSYNKKSIKKSHNEDTNMTDCYQETSSETHISAHNSKNDTDFSEDLTVAKNTNEQKVRDIDMDSFPTTSTGKRNGL